MQKQRPNTLSTQLTELFTEINNTFGRGKELVVKAYNLALQERYTPQEAKNLLLANIKVFGKSTIYSSLPDECKVGRGPAKNSIPKLEYSPDRTVEGRLNEDTTTAEHNFNTEGMGVAILDDDDKEPIDIPPQAQEIIDDAKVKLELIDEGYRLRKENIELISVIETFGLIKEKYTALEKENAALKKELEHFKELADNNDFLYNTIDLLKKENAQLKQELGK